MKYLAGTALDAMHGTGMPSFTVQTQMEGNSTIGQLVTFEFGGMGTPTVADAEAGYEIELTYVRNPYADAGLPRGEVQVNLMYPNRSMVWFTGKVALPEIVPNNLTGSSVKFELTTPAAGIQTDVFFEISTLGWIPTDGRMEISFPLGFTLTSGSSVAIQQTNFGEENAVYVTSLSESERKITLKMAGSLGFMVSTLAPLDRASFRLTKIRSPYSGLTGTFQVRTFSGSNDLIDTGAVANFACKHAVGDRGH